MKNLHMTRETNMPAILVECGFISNPEQEQQLRQTETHKKLAQAIAYGLFSHLGIDGKGGGSMEVKVIVKGKVIQGKLIDSTTYVPLRELVDALRNEVVWDEKDRVAVVK